MTTPRKSTTPSEIAELLVPHLGQADREMALRLLIGKAHPTRWKRDRLSRVATGFRALAVEMGREVQAYLIQRAEQLERIVARRDFGMRISDPTGVTIEHPDGTVTEF